MNADQPEIVPCEVEARQECVLQWRFLAKYWATRLSYLPLVNKVGFEETEAIVMLAIVRASQTFDFTRRCSFSTYAWRGCRQYLRNATKKAGKEKTVPITDVEESGYDGRMIDSKVFSKELDPAYQAQNNEECSGTEGLLRKLKPRIAAILRMRFIEEMTLQEVADAMSLTKERIRQLQAQAIAELRGDPHPIFSSRKEYPKNLHRPCNRKLVKP